MWPNLQKTADLVTFTEETFNGKQFFCVVLETKMFGKLMPITSSFKDEFQHWKKIIMHLNDLCITAQ